jgi:hypothetical protein
MSLDLQLLPLLPMSMAMVAWNSSWLTVKNHPFEI